MLAGKQAPGLVTKFTTGTPCTRTGSEVYWKSSLKKRVKVSRHWSFQVSWSREIYLTRKWRSTLTGCPLISTGMPRCFPYWPPINQSINQLINVIKPFKAISQKILRKGLVCSPKQPLHSSNSPVTAYQVLEFQMYTPLVSLFLIKTLKTEQYWWDHFENMVMDCKFCLQYREKA